MAYEESNDSEGAAGPREVLWQVLLKKWYHTPRLPEAGGSDVQGYRKHGDAPQML